MRIVWILAGAWLISLSSQLGAMELFNEEGYRATLYRSPTPEQHEQATTLAPQELQELLMQQPQAVMIDVLRNPWLHGQFTLLHKHRNLADSVWLPNCGDGSLTEDWVAYCQTWLERLSGADKSFPLVFYCRSDCWLGWNAAKRAHGWGYTNLYWLRDGVEAWQEAGYPLQDAQPNPWPETD